MARPGGVAGGPQALPPSKFGLRCGLGALRRAGPAGRPPAGPAFIMCMYKYKTIWKNFTVMPVMLGLGNRTADGTSCTLHLES